MKEVEAMNKERYGFAHEEPGKKIEASEKVPDFQQMLRRVDRILEEFYEIQGPHIKNSDNNS